MKLKRPRFYFFYHLFSIFLIVFGLIETLHGQTMGFPSDWGYWKRDLILTSAYLGPNALPVPEIRNGELNKNISFSLTGVSHFSSFDRTYNPEVKVYFPIAGGKVAIEVWSVPFEFFNTDSLTLVERKAWSKTSIGKSNGDIYVATLIQVVKNHSYLPDMALSINLKTASGTNLEALRFTDTPGYYFDISMGKSFSITQNFNIRPYGLFGFYVYQTHKPMHLQNDAILWGFGLDLKGSKFSVKSSLGGYYGYFNEGDRPMVLRCSASFRLNRSYDGIFGAQLGLKDNSYASFRVGFRYSFSKTENKIGK